MSILDELCFGCGLFIEDPYYLMLADHHWHLSCLKCFDCGVLLEQEKSCFTKNGRVLCRNDYFKCESSIFQRKNSSICARCHKLIRENDLIHRTEDGVYHFDCFTCSICQIAFQFGDEFGLKDNQIYCREHLFEYQSMNSQMIHDDSGYNTSPNETRHSSFSPPIYFVETDENQSIGYYQTKQKRLRTSFKLNQLRFLRSYFNLNHNPGWRICFFFDIKN